LEKPTSLATDLTQKLILDGTKIGWHNDRVEAWLRGERIAPITIDLALTQTCNYACKFCYAILQTNQGYKITKDVMTRFIDDAAELGVRGISLVSDGESTLNPAYVHTIQYGASKGISMASGSNGYLLDEDRIRAILPHLTYFRYNITAGESKRYQEIMGVREGFFEKVCENIRTMVRVKKELNLSCTIGLQMVLMPEFGDQIMPLARLGKELGPDYLVIKHCSDDEDGSLGVNYEGYEELYKVLHEAEALSTDAYQVSAKWSKIGDKGKRSYQRCYGPPFLLQISGSGLVAPCGMLFNEQYKKFHVGNIVNESFKEMVQGERYWEVVNYLASENFNAQSMCGSICLQHKVNEYLDGIKKGAAVAKPFGKKPEHLNFI
jgi:MoaA/NifB/PqqE/SkfB family radical SAM enzyme